MGAGDRRQPARSDQTGPRPGASWLPFYCAKSPAQPKPRIYSRFAGDVAPRPARPLHHLDTGWRVLHWFGLVRSDLAGGRVGDAVQNGKTISSPEEFFKAMDVDGSGNVDDHVGDRMATFLKPPTNRFLGGVAEIGSCKFAGAAQRAQTAPDCLLRRSARRALSICLRRFRVLAFQPNTVALCGMWTAL